MRVEWHRGRQSLRLMIGLAKARLWGRPLLLSHLVTCRCPCRCETCIWRGLVNEELSAPEIEKVYRDAAHAGMLITSIWGGEPLVREDLGEILRASRQAGLITTLITNGMWFNQRYDELVPWLDAVIFSVDHPSTRHDEMRGMPGLFAAVTAAIEQLRRRNPQVRVYVNSVISRLNQDAALDLARWANRMPVPIYFHPIEVGMLGRPDSGTMKQSLAADEEKLSETCRQLIVLKGRGYPICNSRTYLQGFVGGKRPYRCHARKVCIELRPNGDLMDCLDRFHPVANVLQTPLGDLLSRPDIHRLRMMNVNCQVCNNANVIDTSHIWELRPESVFSLIRRYVSTR